VQLCVYRQNDPSYPVVLSIYQTRFVIP
jgi:hypothetical protein